MKDENEWIPYQDLDFDDKKYNRFNIDTRDFHAGYNFSKEPHPDFETIKKYDKFFHTKDEIKALLDRYFLEAGGKAEWRYFNLEGIENWGMKYIRIWRTELGFIVCNSQQHALNKEFLSHHVEQQHLSLNHD